MRKIILTRGAPGSGKSATIRQLGLEDFCLSDERIRLLYTSPVMTRYGGLAIPQEANSKVWETIYSILDARTERGDFLVLDAAHENRRDFMKVYNLVRRRGYKVACLDFADVPLDLLLQQNEERPSYAQAPEHVIDRMRNNMTWDFPKDVTVIPWDENGDYIHKLEDWLQVPLHNLSSYREIIHIGDLQGCLTPLTGPRGLLRDGFRDDCFYVFVGDLLDRGPENGKLLRWFLDEALPRDNVVLIWGNHEDHLVRWANDEEVRSEEFLRRTLPQLLDEGITKDEVRPLADRLEECFLYRWHDKKVIVTHGGLSSVPSNPVILSGHQLAHGTGYWKDPVDTQFDELAPDGWYQVHGHRNHENAPVAASARSFNLEGAVEFGGNLRALRLNAEGFRAVQVKNDHYLSLRERRSRRTAVIPQWIKREDDGRTFAGPDVLAALRKLQSPEAAPSWENTDFPHIAAITLSEERCLTQAVEGMSPLPSCLFVSRESNEVVARSGDVVLGIDQHEASSLEALKANLRFPVSVYLREDGYRGLLGYDRKGDELFFAADSSQDSFLSANFKRIFEKKIGLNKLEAIKRYLKDAECSLVFEVIDPVNDPRIVEYENEDLFLVDAVRRSVESERLSFVDLKKLAKSFGMKAIEYKLTLNRWDQLESWMEAACSPEYLHHGKLVAGFLFEDSDGFRTSLDSYDYMFWSRMKLAKEQMALAREAGDRITAAHEPGEDPENILASPEAVKFLSYCESLPHELLRQDFIRLRRDYQQHVSRNIEKNMPSLGRS